VADIKAQYRTVMDDHFPGEVSLTIGDTVLTYKKRTWKLPDGSGGLMEKGLRYGENPGQEAALYELAGGNTVGDVELIAAGPGHGQRGGREPDAAGGQASRQDQPDRCGQRAAHPALSHRQARLRPS
jgi:hypothetical protein